MDNLQYAIGVTLGIVAIQVFCSWPSGHKENIKVVKAESVNLDDYDMVIDTRGCDSFLQGHIISHNYIHLSDLSEEIYKLKTINIARHTRCLLIGDNTKWIAKYMVASVVDTVDVMVGEMPKEQMN